MTSCGASVNKRGAQKIKKMIGEGRELRNMKGGIRGEKSVKKKKIKAENNEGRLDKWCRRRAEAEGENKKVEPPKKIRIRRDKKKGRMWRSLRRSYRKWDCNRRR